MQHWQVKPTRLAALRGLGGPGDWSGERRLPSWNELQPSGLDGLEKEQRGLGPCHGNRSDEWHGLGEWESGGWMPILQEPQSGLDGPGREEEREQGPCGGKRLGEWQEQGEQMGWAARHGHLQLVISHLYPMVQCIMKERSENTYVSSS